MQDFVSNEIIEQVAVQITPNKRRYLERKNNHLCVMCGKQNETEKALCPKCSAKKNEATRQDTKFYAAHSLCTRCGKIRVFRNEKMCPECRTKKNIEQNRRGLTDEQKKANNARRRKRYHERLEQGICVLCGRRNAAEGFTKCGMCAAKSRERQREYQSRNKTGIPRTERAQNGLCYICGIKLDMDGKTLCRKCYSTVQKNLKKGQNMYWIQDNNRLFNKNKTYCDVATENAMAAFRHAPYMEYGTIKNQRSELYGM